MRGVFGQHLVGLIVAALCAAGGCSGMNKISSVEGPLTPYSPKPAEPARSVAAAEAPAAAPSGTPLTTNSGPYTYDPSTVDPDLLDTETKKPTFAERMTEASSPKNVGLKLKKLVGRGPNEEVARHAYNEGDLYFREKKYDKAIDFYKVAADRWPDSSLEEDAMFMLGESYFQANQYPRASNMYTKLVKKYENSRHLDMVIKRRFAIGRYWEQRSKDDPVHGLNFKDKTMPRWDTVGNTVAIYESIRMDDPTGPLADDATMATANTLFLNGRWEDASYHYDLMRTEFPQSEFQPQAHLLGMQAKLRSYQGPHYDGKPLQDAKKLGHTLQTQFANQMPNERENIAQTMKVVEAQLAERDYSLGEFYYNSRHYYAAKYYYNEVVKQYPQSRFADLAKSRIDEVKDKPPDPKNEVEWIAGLFRREPAQPPVPAGSVPPAMPAQQPVLAGQPPQNGTPQYPPPGIPGGPTNVARQPQDQR